MTSPLRYVAPAGSPIRLVDLARWAHRSLPGAEPARGLREAIQQRFGVSHVVLTSTGRAGLTVLLRALRRIAPAGKTEVILPTYTCYSVAASAAKAGLRIRLVDISPETLDYEPGALEAAPWDHVLAVIGTNLYGYPNDMPRLRDLARAQGAFLIDDAAQAMGARSGSVLSGTWGDAGLFSFDKGKSVSAVDGGAIVTRSDAIAAAIRAEMDAPPRSRTADSIAGVTKALAYFALLRPSLYGLPAKIPQLGLGRTIYTTDFPLDGPPRALAALAAAMLPRLDEFTRARTANAEAMVKELRGVPGLQIPRAAAGSAPAYVRLPLIVQDELVRDRVLGRLNAAGIGASGSYPASIVDIPELRGVLVGAAGEARGGRYVARRIVTLPTHPFVTAVDIQVATRTVAGVLGGVDTDAARHAALSAHAPGKTR